MRNCTEMHRIPTSILHVLTSGGGRPPRSSSRPCWLHLPSDLTNLLRSYTLKLSTTRQRVHILVKMLRGLHAPPHFARFLEPRLQSNYVGWKKEQATVNKRREGGSVAEKEDFCQGFTALQLKNQSSDRHEI